MFMPRAHIPPRNDSAEKKEHDGIEVKSHSQRREALEEGMRYFVVEDLSASLEKEASGKLSGKLSVEWWRRELEGGMGAHVVHENGTNVWGEIAEVQECDVDKVSCEVVGLRVLGETGS
jgi:hypothetical protein